VADAKRKRAGGWEIDPRDAPAMPGFDSEI
jgi:hypothetical protein